MSGAFANGLLALAVATFLALSGCGEPGEVTGTDTLTGPPPVSSSQGAITGVLLNDLLRPVPGATMLLQEAGKTTTSDARGVFAFGELDPGKYTLRFDAPGHSAGTAFVTVEANAYAEIEVIADRLVNEGSRIITNQFSVFVPCAVGVIANGFTVNCVGDLSGDSYRSGFTSNITGLKNVTYMVNEFEFNQEGYWNVQIREDDGSTSGGERYAVADIENGRSVRIILQKGVLNEEHNAQRNNVPWNGTKEFSANVFLNGQYKNEAQGVYDTVPPEVCDTTNQLCTATGLGAAFGIRANIIQSIFIGEPEDPIASYCTITC